MLLTLHLQLELPFVLDYTILDEHVKCVLIERIFFYRVILHFTNLGQT